MKCPEHPDTDLKKLPHFPRRRYEHHWYFCPVDKHEWLLYKSLMPKLKKGDKW